MKHLTEFESFPLNEERSAKSAWQILDHYMKENPTGKKLA